MNMKNLVKSRNTIDRIDKMKILSMKHWQLIILTEFGSVTKMSFASLRISQL